MPRVEVHGSKARYDAGCRCDLCRPVGEAHTRAMRAVLSTRDPREFKHGRSGYDNYGCRCRICKAGKARYMARWRKQKVREREWAAANKNRRRRLRPLRLWSPPQEHDATSLDGEHEGGIDGQTPSNTPGDS